MEKNLLSEKGSKTTKELSDFLRTVADKIDQGNLTLTRGQDVVELNFPKSMGFRFKVKDDISKSGEIKRKVQIGFRWRLDENSAHNDELTLT